MVKSKRERNGGDSRARAIWRTVRRDGIRDRRIDVLDAVNVL